MRSINITNLKGVLYTTEVFINDKSVYKSKDNSKDIYIKEINYNEKDDIKIIIKHYSCESNLKSFIYYILYWIGTILGVGDTIEEGLPINMYLRVKANENLYIKCFDFKEVDPFKVAGYYSIEENRYITEKKSFIKWISFIIIPFEILLFAIFALLTFIFREHIFMIIILAVIFFVLQSFFIKPIMLVKKYIEF